jgi:hypothetical protein
MRFPNPQEGLDSIHARHAMVHDHSLNAGAETREGLLARTCRLRPPAVVLSGEDQQALNRLVVVNNE